MFSSEIKETVYVAISLILAAAVLGLAAFVLDLRSDFARVQNEEYVTRIEMENRSKYDKYDGKVLYGEDVLALIREFAGTDVSIYIENLKQKNGGNINSKYYDKETYKKKPNDFSIESLEKIDTGISRDVTYISYLVYGVYGEEEIKKAKYVELGDKNSDGSLKYVNYNEVTAVYVKKIRDSREKILDETLEDILNKNR